MPGLCLDVVDDLAARVGHRGLELASDLVGRIDQPHDTLRRAARRRHQPLRLLEVLDPCALVRVDAARHDERLTEALVEALGDVARQLEVLALVVADRHDVGLIEQDVAGHQDRVVEEPGRDEVLALRLLLELRHPAQLAIRSHGAEQPRGLRMSDDVALDEDGRAVRVESRREQPGRHGQGRFAQDLRIERRRDRVQIDDAEEGLAACRGRPVPGSRRTGGSRRCSCRASCRPKPGCLRTRA